MILRVILVLSTFACLFSASLNAEEIPALATDAKSAKPLEKGKLVPMVTVLDADGKEVELASLYKEKPLIIVFFRGGWCPICTKHTQELIKAYPEIKQHGFELIGVSPDSVDNTKANVDRSSIPFPIYSDSDLEAIGSFGLGFKVDDATFSKYKGFGLDLEKASGKSHHGLPVPAVYVVDSKGKVTFAHSDPDYRNRLDAKSLLAEISKK